MWAMCAWALCIRKARSGCSTSSCHVHGVSAACQGRPVFDFSHVTEPVIDSGTPHSFPAIDPAHEFCSQFTSSSFASRTSCRNHECPRYIRNSLTPARAVSFANSLATCTSIRFVSSCFFQYERGVSVTSFPPLAVSEMVSL